MQTKSEPIGAHSAPSVVQLPAVGMAQSAAPPAHSPPTPIVQAVLVLEAQTKAGVQLLRHIVTPAESGSRHLPSSSPPPSESQSSPAVAWPGAPPTEQAARLGGKHTPPTQATEVAPAQSASLAQALLAGKHTAISLGLGEPTEPSAKPLSPKSVMSPVPGASRG